MGTIRNEPKTEETEKLFCSKGIEREKLRWKPSFDSSRVIKESWWEFIVNVYTAEAQKYSGDKWLILVLYQIGGQVWRVSASIIVRGKGTQIPFPPDQNYATVMGSLLNNLQVRINDISWCRIQWLVFPLVPRAMNSVCIDFSHSRWKVVDWDVSSTIPCLLCAVDCGCVINGKFVLSNEKCEENLSHFCLPAVFIWMCALLWMVRTRNEPSVAAKDRMKEEKGSA